MIILAYLTAVSAISVILTVYDKIVSKTSARRISEKTLLLLGFIGGAFAMYCTMRIIRHKTRHAKFMLLLPIFVLLHIAAVLCAPFLGIIPH